MILGVCSDVGKIREVNQDSFYYSDLEELPLFVVADGMGGHNAGEIASNIAVETVKEVFSSQKDMLLRKDIEIPKFINDCLTEANSRIYNKSHEDENLLGMGTTITMAFIANKELFIGHIGDSRAYLLRNDSFIQLTQDHSLVAELVRNGTISNEEALKHPQKNIITRALGTEKDIRIDILSREIKLEDTLLLCTDGLTNMVREEKIKKVLKEYSNVQKASELLIRHANDLGGLDNITAMVIKFC